MYDFERSIWKIQFIFGSLKYPHIEEKNVGGGEGTVAAAAAAAVAATVIFTHYPDVMRLRCCLCKFWAVAAAVTTTIGYGYGYNCDCDCSLTTQATIKNEEKNMMWANKNVPTIDDGCGNKMECRMCVWECVHVQSLFVELLLSFFLPRRCSFFIHLYD